MRSAIFLPLAGVALVVVAVAPDPPAVPATVPQVVGGATLACPSDPVAADRAVAVAVDSAATSGPEGRVTVRDLDTGSELAYTTEADAPLVLVGRGQPQAARTIGVREGFAPAAVAGAVAVGAGSPASTLASVQCQQAGTDWWFVGSGSEGLRESALVLANPLSQQATLDIDMWGPAGPVEALGNRDVEVAGQSELRIRLSSIAPDQQVLAINVRVTSGQTVATVWDAAADYLDQSQGADHLARSVAPSRELVIAGVPAGAGSRELVLANPGNAPATSQVRILGAEGLIEDLANVVVPPGRVVVIDMVEELAGRSGALRLRSDAPITGSMRVAGAGVPRDLAWLTAVPGTGRDNPLAGGQVLVGTGLTSVISVAAAGEEDARGVLRFFPSAPLPSNGTVGAGAPPGDVHVEVPAGSQLDIPVPPSAVSSVTSVIWRADADAGPAHLAHLTTGAGGLTGYQWWPTLSTVPVDQVREDAGALIGGTQD